MSAMQRAMPFIVAVTAGKAFVITLSIALYSSLLCSGVISGIYVFKPMFVNEAHDLSVLKYLASHVES
jgi:hypothetical protein